MLIVVPDAIRFPPLTLTIPASPSIPPSKVVIVSAEPEKLTVPLLYISLAVELTIFPSASYTTSDKLPLNTAPLSKLTTPSLYTAPPLPTAALPTKLASFSNVTVDVTSAVVSFILLTAPPLYAAPV